MSHQLIIISQSFQAPFPRHQTLGRPAAAIMSLFLTKPIKHHAATHIKVQSRFMHRDHF
ncbi:hypothetical protein BJV77DRAFT_979435 [Russula vinacea]|nr:hypothetical protein BJV77DRAFT_979435 [Russula vinacea]